MDNFLIMSYLENSNILNEVSFIAFTAAASMIISSKLHNARNPLVPVRFSCVFFFFSDDFLLLLCFSFSLAFLPLIPKIFYFLKEML
jgi:hypothetical protein